MSTVDKAGRALRAGFGGATVAALVLMNACASGNSADNSGPLEEASSAETTEALMAGPAGKWACTLAGGTVAGTLTSIRGPDGNLTCIVNAPRLPGSLSQYCLGTPVFGTCPDCYGLGDDWGCAWG
jgi:hypothetical protein